MAETGCQFRCGAGLYGRRGLLMISPLLIGQHERAGSPSQKPTTRMG